MYDKIESVVRVGVGSVCKRCINTFSDLMPCRSSISLPTHLHLHTQPTQPTPTYTKTVLVRAIDRLRRSDMIDGTERLFNRQVLYPESGVW